MKRYIITLALINFLNISLANAQTVLSLGVQEIYDDNIYLEDDKKVDVSNLPDDFILPEQIDGDPQDDLITNVYLGASGNIPLSPYIKTAADGKIGALIFADQTDESRLILDGVLSMDSEKTLIPEPFYISFLNSIKSQSDGIGVADGTSARQSETYTLSLIMGVKDVKLAQATDLDASYSFNYNKFLEDFTFNNNADEDLGIFENRIKPRGADYFLNSLDASITHLVFENFEAGIYGGLKNYSYTKVESGSVVEQDEDDLDRNETQTGIKTKYILSKQVTFKTNVGINYSRFKNKPQDTSGPVLQDDGTIMDVPLGVDQGDLAFIFGGELEYVPDPSALFRLAIDQSRRTDIDGDRLLTRTIGLDATKSIGDRVKLNLGGRFLQYNVGDSLKDPTERFDLTTAIQYSLTESIALSAGWNYVNQDADNQNLTQQLLNNTQDYEGNRFFIGLSTGLIGKPS